MLKQRMIVNQHSLAIALCSLYFVVTTEDVSW